MTQEEVNKALYEKMRAEQDRYRNWLMSQPSEEILRNAYEYSTKEDILFTLQEYGDLDAEQAEALLKTESPLSGVYNTYERQANGHIPVLRECMEHLAEEVIRQERGKEPRETPLYIFPASYAREHGELDQYRESRRVNIACRDAIDAAIQAHYRDFSVDVTAVREVAENFGCERMFYVLANTVRIQDWDKRYSGDNRRWAMTVPVYENPDGTGGDRNRDFVLRSHPAKADAFIKAARQEYQQAQEATARTTKIESRKPGRKRKKAPER